MHRRGRSAPPPWHVGCGGVSDHIVTPFPILLAASALLVSWSLLRRRRILATAGVGSPTIERDVASTGRTYWPSAITRPRFADIGLNPLGRRLVLFNAVVLAADILLFSARGLTLEWSTARLGPLMLGSLLVVWLNYYFLPGGSEERFVAEVPFVVFLLILLTNLASPMQYGAVAVGAPYADSWLAAADTRMGVNVAALAAWTRAHPTTSTMATLSYFSLLPQFCVAVLALAVLRDRERLWEFAFHFHACLIVTIAALAIWPAVCPPAYYGFTPTIDMTRLIGQIKGFHQASTTVVRFDQLEGLVSFPSFHVAGAFIVTWAFRARRRFFIPLIALNVCLVTSTFVTGVHYLIDVIAAVPLFGASLAAYQWWGRSLLNDDQSKAERVFRG
jgi:hypothetical protein